MRSQLVRIELLEAAQEAARKAIADRPVLTEDEQLAMLNEALVDAALTHGLIDREAYWKRYSAHWYQYGTMDNFTATEFPIPFPLRELAELGAAEDADPACRFAAVYLGIIDRVERTGVDLV